MGADISVYDWGGQSEGTDARPDGGMDAHRRRDERTYTKRATMSRTLQRLRLWMINKVNNYTLKGGHSKIVFDPFEIGSTL